MKINKFVAVGIAVTSIGASVALASTSAMAATSPSYQMTATHIQLDGKNFSNPDHIIAKDPWGGSLTTWVPVYYLQQVLQSAGFATSWNGKALSFVKYPSGWVTGAALGNPEAPAASSNQMQIDLVNNAPPSEDIPKIVSRDPASGVETTYTPIYYINQILNRYWLMNAAWNGTVWSMWTQQNSPLTTQSYASNGAAAQAVTNLAANESYFKFDAGTVNLGSGITAKTGAFAGQEGYQWHEGNWIVDDFYYTKNANGEQVAKDVVSYLHTHMLPAPNHQGVILINSTDANAATVVADTTIAWQEGSKVNQLQRPGNPIQTLQTVVNSK